MYIVADLLDHTTEFVAQGQWNFLVGDGVGRRWHDIGTTEILMQVLFAVLSTNSRTGSCCNVPVPQMPTQAGFTYREDGKTFEARTGAVFTLT